MAHESMFWEIVPEDVFEALAEHMSADYGREWRTKKDRMETATGATCTDGVQDRYSQESTRQGNLVKFWWMTDPFYRDSSCKNANVQPKAVFSYATVMDKISGREDEERW